MLSLNELNDLTNAYGFPDEAAAFFSSAAERVLASKEAVEQLLQALQAIKECEDRFERVEPYLDRVSEIIGIGRRSVDMLFRLLTVDEVIRVYRSAGICEAIAKETVSANIIAELEENRRVYGDWGTFVLWFHTRLYQCKLFKLGRLQFEITDDSDAVFCHIISFLPFSMEAVTDSIRQAYEFFGFARKRKPMKVVTETWMLHPAFQELLPNGSNIKAFRGLFTVTDYRDTDSELWYIFWKPQGTPISELPADTGLQKRCREYLQSGKSLGEGSGYFLYRENGMCE